MRLKSLRIENFRIFRDQTIQFDDYTCFVGPNGAGKSTVFTALNVFFRQSPEPSVDLATLTEEDFHKKNTKAPIKITLTFSDLTTDEQTEFKHYYRQNQLVVMAKAEWNPASNSAPVMQYGIRNVMTDFAPYFEASEAKKKADDLKQIYAEIREKYTDLDKATTKDAIEMALRDYEEAHPDLCELRDSEDQLYGVSKGSNLQKFIKWVYIPPVKLASDEETEAKKTAIGQLLDIVVRKKVSFEDEIKVLREKALEEYRTLVGDKQDMLDEVSNSLCTRLQSWATPRAKIAMQWASDDKNVSVTQPMARVLAGDDGFLGSLTRLGHGLQRAYIIALLEEVATLSDESGNGLKLLLACEEPELHQHPPQQRHLMNVFEQLSEKNQVMVTTHSPYFVSGSAFEHVRMVRNVANVNEATIASTTFDDVAQQLARVRVESKPATPTLQQVRLQQALQPALNEMFFSPVVVLVEGLEDAAYLTSCLILMAKWEEFRRLGCHIVPVAGKSDLIQPIIIAKKFNIPCFVIFDSDSGVVEAASQTVDSGIICGQCKEEQEKRLNKAKDRMKRHGKDNQRILKALGHDGEDIFPSATIWKDDLVVWQHDIHTALEEDVGKSELQAIEQSVRTAQHLNGPGDIKKHELMIGYVLQAIYADGKKAASLEKACEAIIAFAKSIHESHQSDSATVDQIPADV